MQPITVAIFLSAFLLFQVQLLLAKYILPWFGGAASVWTTSLLFFQTLLLGGYAYAHGLARRPRAVVQRRLHLALLTASLLLLGGLAYTWGAPLLPDDGWKPSADGEPVTHILWLLAAGVGLPFFVLSATNPLLTAWWSHSHPGASPYRLYALSNLGSLLGLASYPLVVEVFVPLKLQAWLWAGGYAVFAVAILASARRAGAAKNPAPAASSARIPAVPQRLLWFGLAACASLLLLATTNQITQEIAAVPFLWMLPLVLYLLSFILCFDGDRRYDRRYYAPALVAMLVVATLLLQHGLKASIVAQIALYSLALFVACMALHGELARLKPAPRHATGYYLTITAGGAAGGLFVGLVAPRLFPGFWELPLGLWLSAALYAWALWRDRESFLHRLPAAGSGAVLACTLLLGGFVLSDRLAGGDPATLLQNLYSVPFLLLASAGLLLWLSRGTALALAGGGHPAADASPSGASQRRKRGLLLASLLAYGAILAAIATGPLAGAIASERNFYGVVAVVEANADDPDNHVRELRHGRILHGMQLQAAPLDRLPGGYYGPHSGIGLALLERLREPQPLHIGVVGLGAGTLAAYGRAGDRLRFYEINPAVIALAHGPRAAFSYLADTDAEVEIVPGDARLALERELAETVVQGCTDCGAEGRNTGPQGFDVLVVDAFSSDAIPVHLLTREAVALYLAHLDPERGILALNISSRYVELKPLAARLAHDFGLDLAIVDSFGKTSAYEWSSDWVLLARPGALARLPAVVAAAEPAPLPAAKRWTDDYSNLLGVLRLSAAPLPARSQAGGIPSGGGILDFLDRPDGGP
jgi:hypothetical protein